jgi:hypothetical protein
LPGRWFRAWGRDPSTPRPPLGLKLVSFLGALRGAAMCGRALRRSASRIFFRPFRGLVVSFCPTACAPSAGSGRRAVGCILPPLRGWLAVCVNRDTGCVQRSNCPTQARGRLEWATRIFTTDASRRIFESGWACGGAILVGILRCALDDNSVGLQSVGENFRRPSGTRLDFSLSPARKRRAIVRRPAGAQIFRLIPLHHAKSSSHAPSIFWVLYAAHSTSLRASC